jgi:uncharacterized RDD family membrane protein YckC
MATQVEGRSVSMGRSQGKTETIKRSAAETPPFALRCGAILIDYIAIAGIIAFSTLFAEMAGGGARVAGGTAELMGLLVAAGLLVINFVVLAGLTGQTIGKWATGMRIETRSNGELNFGRVALRHCVGYPISILTLGLGFLFAVFSSEGRTLHDLIAGTVVVRKRSAGKLRYESRGGSKPFIG